MATKGYDRDERFALVMLGKRIMSERHDIVNRLDALSKTVGISQATIRRWIIAYDEKGMKGLRRQGRSDKGVSRTTCIWAIKRAYRLAVSPKLSLSQNQIRAVLLEEAQQSGSEFCIQCRYSISCKMVGNGIIVGSRHSLNRILSCAKLPNHNETR